MTGTRDGAIARAEKYFDEGGFLAELQRRVAIPTTSQEQDSMPALQQYVSGEMTESLQKLGYGKRVCLAGGFKAWQEAGGSMVTSAAA